MRYKNNVGNGWGVIVKWTKYLFFMYKVRTLFVSVVYEVLVSLHVIRYLELNKIILM